MKTLKTLWQFKWVALITLIIEWMVLAPALAVMLMFGDNKMALNLAVTPIGSSDFFGIFFDAMSASNGLAISMVALAVSLPVLLMVKLALATGTMASMQSAEWRLSSWLSEAGRHFFRALGLFLRWLIVPVILVGIPAAIMKAVDVESKMTMISVLAVFWFISLSWLFLSLNGVAEKQRWSLKNGAITLFKNFHHVVLAIVIFGALAALVQYFGWLAFVANSDAETGVFSGVVTALLIALFMRVAILFWQSSHVSIWQKHWQS